MESFQKRKRVRSRIDLEASYRFSSSWYPCQFRDLTTEGAGLKINQILVPGDLIRVRWGSIDREMVEARVANVNGNRIGVKFTQGREIQSLLLALMKAPLKGGVYDVPHRARQLALGRASRALALRSADLDSPFDQDFVEGE